MPFIKFLFLCATVSSGCIVFNAYSDVSHEGEKCFFLKYLSYPLNTFFDPETALIPERHYSRNNLRDSHIIYHGFNREHPVYLLNLKTGGNKEFVSSGYETINTGFSDEGTYAYALLQNGDLKLLDLASGGEERIFSGNGKRMGENSIIKLKETDFSLYSLQYPEEEENGNPDKPENRDVILGKWDLKAGSQTYQALPKDQMRCYSVSDEMTYILFVDKDGALYRAPLPLLGPFSTFVSEEPIRLFEPVKDFELSEDNCAFLSRRGLNILRVPEGKFYIVREINSGESFVVPDEWMGTPLTETEKEIFGSRPFFPLFFHWPFITKRDPSGPYFGSGKIYAYTGQYIPFDDIALSYTNSLTNRGNRIFLDRAAEKCRVIHISDKKEKTILESSTTDYCEFIGYDNRTALISMSEGLFLIDGDSGAVLQEYPAINTFIKSSEFTDNFFIQSQQLSLETINWHDDTKNVHTFQTFCPKLHPNLPTEASKDILLKIKAAEIFDPSLILLLASALERPEIFTNHSELLQTALWNVLIHLPDLYLSLHHHYPELGDLSPLKDLPETLSDHFKKNLTVAVSSLLQNIISENHPTQLSDYRALHLLQPVLERLPPEEQKIHRENITLSLVRGATQNIPLLEDVFKSKIYYIAHGSVRELWGLSRKPVSDIAFVRIKEDPEIQPMKPLILSSDPIEVHKKDAASVATNFGIHYAVLEGHADITVAKKGEELIDDFIEWSLSGQEQNFRARIQVHAHLKREKILEAPALDIKGPDYSSLWRDGKMTGAIFIGSQHRSNARFIANELLSYLTGEGFEFSRAHAVDFKATLLQWIASGKLDWLLTQSHSGGDSLNVLKMDPETYLIRAVRYGSPPLPQKNMEEIWIVFSRPFLLEGEEPVIVSISDFKQAFSKRDGGDYGQFVFFNTSCWSTEKAAYQIDHIDSPLFLNIPSFTITEVFENRENGAARALLHSFRNGLDFDGFREALSGNEGYQSQELNHYVFPDEPIYEKEVNRRLDHPVSIHLDIEVQREDGSWEKNNYL